MKDLRVVSTPEDVFNLVCADFRALDHEEVKLLSLDSQNRLLACETISDGGVGIALLRPRQVFTSALKNSATFIVLVHNHPSGNPEPSHEDIVVTRRIARIGKLLNVFLLDHIIIGDGKFVSMRARGLLSSFKF